MLCFCFYPVQSNCLSRTRKIQMLVSWINLTLKNSSLHASFARDTVLLFCQDKRKTRGRRLLPLPSSTKRHPRNRAFDFRVNRNTSSLSLSKWTSQIPPISTLLNELRLNFPLCHRPLQHPRQQHKIKHRKNRQHNKQPSRRKTSIQPRCQL